MNNEANSDRITSDMLNLNVHNIGSDSDSNYSIDDLRSRRFFITNRLNFEKAASDPRVCRPQINARINLEALKKNYIYQSIKYATGFSTDDTSPVAKWSIVQMLQNRQNGIGSRQGPFSQPERCKLNNIFLPNCKKTIISYGDKVTCGTFSRNGKHFVSAGQANMIGIYDSTTNRYKCQNKIIAKVTDWWILDIAFHPSSNHLVYSNWSECLHLSRIDGRPHELKPLYLEPLSNYNFCIFSVASSNCRDQIIGGSSDGCLYIYDLVLDKRTFRYRFELNINSVGFIDDATNIIYSGSDNGTIKIWDLRCLNETHPKEVGVFSGHLDGITYIDSKNDARYLISNSKDQTIKLWDMRQFSPSSNINLSLHNWDYRWNTVPKEYYTDTVTLPSDASIMTYRGHSVRKTLIRAKFSPQEMTGQRYIYTGCGTGRLIIYDILTGEIVYSARGHKDIVRDIAWHPSRCEILTSSWDYNVNLNFFSHGQHRASNFW